MPEIKKVPECFLKAFRDYKEANPDFKPLVVFWNNKYFCSYSFTKEEVKRRTMEVIYG